MYTVCPVLLVASLLLPCVREVSRVWSRLRSPCSQCRTTWVGTRPHWRQSVTVVEMLFCDQCIISFARAQREKYLFRSLWTVNDQTIFPSVKIAIACSVFLNNLFVCFLMGGGGVIISLSSGTSPLWEIRSLARYPATRATQHTVEFRPNLIVLCMHDIAAHRYGCVGYCRQLSHACVYVQIGHPGSVERRYKMGLNSLLWL